MKRIIFLMVCLCSKAMAQSDLVVGTTYQFNIQRQGPHGDAFLLHNAQYSSSTDLLSWKTTHASMGSRGIRFSYSGGISFYADNTPSTASSTFTPTTRFYIGNNGNIGIGTTTPLAKLHLTGGNFIFDTPSGNPTIFTGTGTAELNKYLALNNSPDYTSASGLKAGGVLVSDMYSYANPGKNDLVVKGNIGIGTPSATDRLQIGGEGRINIRVGRWASFGETYSAIATVIGTNVKASNDAVNKMEVIQTTGDGGKAIKMQYNEGISFHTVQGNVTAGAEFAGYERMRITNDGNVGIGTASPQDRIHIGGSGRVNMRVGRWASLGETYSGLATIIGTNVKASNDAVNKLEVIETTGDGGKAIKMQYNEGISFHTFQGSVTAGAEFTGYERMRIDNNGNVGIGTSAPDAKLAVKGLIHTQEVNVDLLGAVAPDYVFEPDYDLTPLSEVEQYVKENKHLPEVPSAKQMSEEGLSLKEMNLLLLKKVEELTLHLIDEHNQNAKRDEEIKYLKDQLSKLTTTKSE